MTSSPREALVVGGTKGVGRAIARRLAAEGHAVIAVYRSDEAARQKAEREFASERLNVGFERVDLLEPGQLQALFARLSSRGRSPELLVNALGLAGTEVGPSASDSADALVSASLRVTLGTCQEAVKAMTVRRFGRIINFSVHPALLEEGQSAFAAANAGVLGLTRALAREVARFAITVNAVIPGILRPDGLGEPSARQLGLVQQTPLKRAATGAEIAGIVNMLCADAAAYITGQCLSIDGGLS